MKKQWFIISVLLVAFCLSACRSETTKQDRTENGSQAASRSENSSTNELQKEPEKITVLCNSDSMVCRLVEQAAIDLRDKYDINIIRKWETEIDETILSHKGTIDLVVSEVTTWTAWTVDGSGIPSDRSWACYQDLTPFMDNELTFDENQYLPGTLEAGFLGGKQLFFPLSITTNIILMSEEQAEKEEYQKLSEMPSLSDIYQLYQTATGSHLRAGDDSWISLLGGDFGSATSGMELLLQSGDIQIDWETGQVTAQEEGALQTLEFLKIMRRDWQKENIPSFGDKEFPEVIQQSLGMIDNNFSGWYLNYRSEQYRTELEQEMNIMFLPKAESAEHYAVELSAFAGILKESQNPEAAYEILRYISNMDASYWVDTSSRADFPARADQAEMVLSTLSTVSETEEGEMKAPISEQAAEKLQLWLTGVDSVYLYPLFAEEQTKACMDAYYNGDINEEACISELCEILEEKVKAILANIAA